MSRLLRACLLLACLAGAALSAATRTEKSGASQKLLAAYRQDDPAAVGRAALALAEKGNPEAQFIAGLLQDIGAGLVIDHASARAWLEKAAFQKHDGAMLLLAWKAQTGFGLPRADPAEAARWRAQAGPVGDDAFEPWLTKGAAGFEPALGRAFLWMLDAADAGDVAAMRNLAECYLQEYWTTPSTTDHIRWLERASEAGNFESMLVLSVYCESGTLVPADPAKALALRRRAAEGGYALGQFVLANQYEQGRGVPADPAAALQWYTKAAKQDHIPAILRLIDLRRIGSRDIPQDFKEAVRLAERGRRLGDAACTRNLADLYNRGEGVKRDLPRSVTLYEEAALKGDAPAMTMLGWMRRNAQDGITDFSASRRWYTKAAELGQVRAMIELAEMNDQGLGSGPNPSVAFAWYEKAGRLGDPVAQQMLGLMLLRGRGLAKDPEEAVNWLRLADKNTPARSLQPRARDWLKDAAELADAVEGLLAVAREEQDPWLEYNLLQATQQDPVQRKDFEERILRVTQEPDLLAVPGCLPEICLSVLEANPARQTEAEAWFNKLLAADRLQSAWWLGRHALAGRYLPHDPARAASWAKVVSASQALRGAILTALCDLQATDDAARVDQGVATLLKFADAGDPNAGLALAERVAAGKAKPPERQRVQALQPSLLAYARLTGRADLANKLELQTTLASAGAPVGAAFKTPTPAGPIESVIEAKVAAALKARKPGSSASPVALYRIGPFYPYELRRLNINGAATVEFTIDPDGRVREAQVVETTHPLLVEPALAAVKQWRFVPGWKDGKAVAVHAKQQMEFNATLDSPPEKN